MAPEEAGCPAAYFHFREECCVPGIFQAIFYQFGDITPGDVAKIMPLEDYPRILSTMGWHLQRFVRDIDILNADAWWLLAMVSLREAIFHVDGVKDRFVAEHSVGGMRDVLQTAIEASRRLGRALFRAENLHQFLISYTAMAQQTFIKGLSPEVVRGQFSPVLGLYKEGVMARDLLAYRLIPAMEGVLQARNDSVALAGPHNPVVMLLVVSLGAWAKTGFITIWSLLQHRTTPLRIFVLGDAPGLAAWHAAVDELRAGAQGERVLRAVDFEYIDFMKERRFRAYLGRYPKNCVFGDAGQAILARVVCHEVLPRDVDRVIAIDLGDILVLDDIRDLWDIGDKMEDHHLLAAAHAVSLHHINGGLVLYDVRRMRERNFTRDTLRAARDGVNRDPDGVCLRDQSIINILHRERVELGYTGPSPVMVLPCRWSLFPATEWQPHWNSPEMWLPEVVERRRYPGIISMGHVELYCPDEVDMLSAWAFIPVSEKERSRQSRLRLYAHHEGSKGQRYCAERTVGDRCCRCGERAALLHVAGDLKAWPSMQTLLQAYLPPWREPPRADALVSSSSRGWWGGDARALRIADGTEEDAYAAAKGLGLHAVFKKCSTVGTKPHSPGMLMYNPVEVQNRALPMALDVETTVPQDAHILIGIGGHTGLELVLGMNAGTTSSLRWVRTAPGWAVRQDMMSFDSAPQQFRAEAEGSWSNFTVRIGLDARFEVRYGDVYWGSYVPESVFAFLRKGPITVSVGTLAVEGHWAICLAT